MGVPAEPRLQRLPALSAERAGVLLSPPELPEYLASDVTMARAAAEQAIPLLVQAPVCARPLLLVRALHTVGHRGGPVLLASADACVDGPLPAGATLVVVLEAPAAGPWPTLDALLDEPPAWIVVVCDPTFALPASLSLRLGSVRLRVPALADDVAALAERIVADVATRSGRPGATLGADACAALGRHHWPGGRIELEAVVRRAVLAAGPGGTIDAAALDVAEGVAAPPPAPRAQGDAPAPPDVTGPRLAYLVAELAHELRNPLVTVKTFAQQLPALLDDAALRTRFAELTDEAIERMDGLLENVLEFTRLPPPRPECMDVGAVLDRVVADLGPALEAREVHVRRVGAGARCAADPEHLGYALSNLLIGIAHETPPRADVVVDTSVNGVVSLRFGTGATITRLRALAAPDAAAALDDPTFLPLAFTLARAVLERSGAQLAVTPDLGGQATVTVRLPPVDPGGS